MRLGLRFVLFASVAALAVACTSPTLPLPPPDAPTESAGTQAGTIVLSGTATPGALIVVENLAQSAAAAAIVSADGKWTVTILASAGDQLQITEIIGDKESQPREFTVL